MEPVLDRLLKCYSTLLYYQPTLVNEENKLFYLKSVDLYNETIDVVNKSGEVYEKQKLDKFKPILNSRNTNKKLMKQWGDFSFSNINLKDWAVWALSNHIDLWNLIEDGYAIDKMDVR